MVYKTRERLIEVARQLFVHKGLENTTMNDIANASEMGRRTIYTYFKNKKEIYNAVLEHESDSMVAALKKIAESDLPPDVKLTRFLMLRLEQSSSMSSSNLKSLFKFDLRRIERIRRMVLDKEIDLLKSILNEGISAGYFDPERSALASRFLLRGISGLDLAEITSDNANETMELQSYFVDFIVSDLTYRHKAKQSSDNINDINIQPPLNNFLNNETT